MNDNINNNISLNVVGGKPRSLVEQKRLQWARERDEMANLCAPWGKKGYERYPMKGSYPGDYYYQRSSLPPLNKSANHKQEIYNSDNQGGETSGYASDCAPHGTSDVWSRRRSSGVLWSRDAVRAVSPTDSVSTTTGERLRWGDRGVGVGHLWEPHEVDQRPSIMPGDGSPPGWLQRGLKNDTTEVMLINSHQSEKESSEDTESIGTRSYLRGQNIPLDASVIAEREQKRQRAILHQQAICQQLEEREKQKREEKERKRKEERLEEERIKREQEQERQRLMKEQQMVQERIERERKRQELMKQALQDAERSAQIDKQKKKYAKMYGFEENSNQSILDNKLSPTPSSRIHDYPDIVPPIAQEQHKLNNDEAEMHHKPNPESPRLKNSPRHSPHKIADQTQKFQPYIDSSSEANQTPFKAHSRPYVDSSSETNQTPFKTRTFVDSSSETNQMPFNTRTFVDSASETNQTPFKHPDVLNHADGLALVLQSTPYSTLDTGSLSSLQFALLMTPQHSANGTLPPQIPVAIPLSARSNSVATNTLNLTENRILTPTKYRQQSSNSRDASTQTEKIEFGTEVRQKEYKYGSLDRQTVNRSRRERRLRSEERSAASDRPKWGVNKPPTQYLTQSEKDPVYQRRKLQKKMHELKLNDDKNNNDSSEDSRSPSPVSNSNNKKTMSRRNEKMLLHNLNVYQTEIIPIEADSRGRLYVGQSSQSGSRRQSISEKFFIAKQNRNKSSDYENKNYSSRKHRLNKQNETKRLSTDENSSTYWQSAEILSQLSNLKNNLLQKQKTWETSSSPRSDPLDIDTDVI